MRFSNLIRLGADLRAMEAATGSRVTILLQNKTTIHFGEVFSTKMSCNDIQFETAFLSALNKVNRFEDKGRNLLLKRGNDVLLILEQR
jgi:hypothetical protein